MDHPIEELARNLAATHRHSLYGAGVHLTCGVSKTEYSIVGPLSAVQKVIESVFLTYPPLGYGTCVHLVEGLSDGSYGARMSRSNSAD